MVSSPIFGVDFDNTIVSYDHLFHKSAQEIGVEVPRKIFSKKALRDYVRSLKDGELIWQKIQADVYGRRMFEAKLIDGFDAFVETCRSHSIPVFIVSHKTELAAQDPELNLRSAAVDWMTGKGFFDGSRFGFSHSDIFFEDTRQNKIRRIHKLGCTHFVDDMEEVLLDDEFPRDTVKMLFSGKVFREKDNGLRRFSSWHEIFAFIPVGKGK